MFQLFNNKKMNMKHNIPTQYEGKDLNISDSIEFENEIAAKNFYLEAKNRLLQINNWDDIAKVSASTFQHLDSFGNYSNEKPEEGDYVKIDIPGPGLYSTGGYDYVKIEQISETNEPNNDLITMTLRPSSKPDDEGDHETKHFFKNLASSTFQVKRNGRIVEANYYGRNELINTDLDSLIDRIRNLFVAFGAKLGASYPQWKSLISGILNK